MTEPWLFLRDLCWAADAWSVFFVLSLLETYAEQLRRAIWGFEKISNVDTSMMSWMTSTTVQRMLNSDFLTGAIQLFYHLPLPLPLLVICSSDELFIIACTYFLGQYAMSRAVRLRKHQMWCFLWSLQRMQEEMGEDIVVFLYHSIRELIYVSVYRTKFEQQRERGSTRRQAMGLNTTDTFIGSCYTFVVLCTYQQPLPVKDTISSFVLLSLVDLPMADVFFVILDHAAIIGSMQDTLCVRGSGNWSQDFRLVGGSEGLLSAKEMPAVDAFILPFWTLCFCWIVAEMGCTEWYHPQCTSFPHHAPAVD